MKFRKIINFFIIILSFALAADAYGLEVYKTVDENGEVVLSDRPIKGAKQEVLHMTDLQDQIASPGTQIPANIPESNSNKQSDHFDNQNTAAINPAPNFTLQEPTKINDAKPVAPQAPARPAVNTQAIKKLIDMRTQLFRLQSFYQKIQDDYQRSPSVNTQDENYRRTLITVVEKHLQSLEQNIVSLEGSLGPLPQTTLAMANDMVSSNSQSQLPLSPTQIAKLSSMFPEK